MAVIQISQIQVRRGLLEELAQLGAGEFGWAIDKLRLFIGNGLLEQGAPYEGNTEILTVNSDIMSLLANYTYKGFQGGYQVQTGPDLNNPSRRTIQDKLDDFINVKDYGAIGNGENDDTDAIQRCIDETYNRKAFATPAITRRTIRFHPGTYLISKDLKIPPYCVFRNSGKDSVFIVQTSLTANCVFKLTTSIGISSDMFNNGLTEQSQLGPVEISGITFKSDVANIPIGLIDSAKNVTFNQCRFEGVTDLATVISNSKGVKITSAIAKASSIYFNECDFYKSGVAAEITNTVGIDNVTFDKCTFGNVFQGVKITSDTGNVLGIKITSSLFNNVGAQGIVTSSESVGVISAYNTFVNVGHDYNVENNPVTPVIELQGNLSYSLGDIITRTLDQDLVVPAIRQGINKSVISTDASNHIKLGHTYMTIGKSVIAANNSNNFIPVPVKYRRGLINYSIERNNEQRFGTIKFGLNITNVGFEFHDSYTETGPTGVEMSVEYNSSGGSPKPYIICAVDGSGAPVTLTYDIKSLIR